MARVVVGLLGAIYLRPLLTWTSMSSRAEISSHHDATPLAGLPSWVLFVIAFLCVGVAAVVAGLTLGLMSLDMIGLEILSHSTHPSDAENARKIIPVRREGNLLLVTLLLTNTMATELLPLVLETLYPGGVFALVASVISVMLFSEIIPQAVCSRHALAVGAFFVPFVRILQFGLYPLAKPIAVGLDWFLGEELGTIYSREELKELIRIHSRNRHGVLTDDETTILRGTLDFAMKTVEGIMTRADDVFMLEVDTVLGQETFKEILKHGHSRIPIYSKTRDNVVALLLTKQLLLIDPKDEIPVRVAIGKRKKKLHKIRAAPPLFCSRATPLADLLNEFQLGRSHMAVVYDDVSKPQGEKKFLGIATLEDIIEEILQEEIVDETDLYTDNVSKRAVESRSLFHRLRSLLSLPEPSHCFLSFEFQGKKPVVAVSAQRIQGTSTILVKEIDTAGLQSPMKEGLSGKPEYVQLLRSLMSTRLNQACPFLYVDW
mmetsp:Transcript_849/g.1821  ORF Transcript_849/g.1821 Transcript_849/m.1821 type:complete len:488 (-) Transcript_849:740-2203(-)